MGRIVITLATAIVLLVCAMPADAQDETSKHFGFVEVGPGVFTSLDEDTTSAEVAGTESYIGGGVFFGSYSLSARVNFRQETQRSVVTSGVLWGTFYVSGSETGPYLALGVGSDFQDVIRIQGKGGYSFPLLSENVLVFGEAEGRMITADEVNSEAVANLGIRVLTGRR